jgi:hypothetical protein
MPVRPSSYCRTRPIEAADASPPGRGIVEIDGTFIGGKHKGRENWWENKIAVIGAVQRGGEIRLGVVPYSNRFQFRKFVDESVAPETEAIYTDDNVTTWALRIRIPATKQLIIRRSSGYAAMFTQTPWKAFGACLSDL